MGERITGTVKFFDTKKSFGFITRADGAGDAFVHANNLADGIEIDQGDLVSFEVEPSRNGKGPRAVKVALA